jgi:hypothetical protein
VYLGSEYLEVLGSVIYHSFHYLCHSFSFLYVYVISFLLRLKYFIRSLCWTFPRLSFTYMEYSIPWIFPFRYKYIVLRGDIIYAPPLSLSLYHCCDVIIYVHSIYIFFRSVMTSCVFVHLGSVFHDVMCPSLTPCILPLRHMTFLYVICPSITSYGFF